MDALPINYFILNPRSPLKAAETPVRFINVLSSECACSRGRRRRPSHFQRISIQTPRRFRDFSEMSLAHPSARNLSIRIHCIENLHAHPYHQLYHTFRNYQFTLPNYHLRLRISIKRHVTLPPIWVVLRVKVPHTLKVGVVCSLLHKGPDRLPQIRRFLQRDRYP